MSVLVSIGDFSRMTHLSIKALRFYHDQGLLEPARIDPDSGYRFYEPAQVPVAQVIRRFRDLDMPLDQVKAVLQAPDLETRIKEIISHLTAMEAKLAEMQMSVASLRSLLEGPPAGPAAEFRSIPAARVMAVQAAVTAGEAWAWGADAFEELYARIGRAGSSPAGPGGALFPADKLRGKSLVIKPGRSRRYQVPFPAARTISALLTLRDQVIGPLIAGIRTQETSRKPVIWTGIDRDYEALRADMYCLFRCLGIDTARRRIDSTLLIEET
jgi:DNA-binding transcriptional MerR regulator